MNPNSRPSSTRSDTSQSSLLQRFITTISSTMIFSLLLGIVLARRLICIATIANRFTQNAWYICTLVLCTPVSVADAICYFLLQFSAFCRYLPIFAAVCCWLLPKAFQEGPKMSIWGPKMTPKWSKNRPKLALGAPWGPPGPIKS